MRPSIAVLPFPQPKRCTFLQWYKYTLFRHFIQLTNCKRFASRPPRKNSSRTKLFGPVRLQSITFAYFFSKWVRLPSKPCLGMGFALCSNLGAS